MIAIELMCEGDPEQANADLTKAIITRALEHRDCLELQSQG